jgi:O-phosphoseryl-tRNA synthetase
MIFDTKSIREKAEKDYEKAWLETAKQLKFSGHFFKLENKKRPHPLMDFLIKIRSVLLDLGFTEVILPTIVEKKEVYLQYGPEAPIILDRIFFLAGLRRPDIGISKKRIEQIKKIASLNIEKLQNIFRRYKEAKIEADNLIQTIVSELKIKEEEATKIISIVFPEFKELTPIPTDLTLRSHMTACWFKALKEIYKRERLPLQLFTIGTKFRREQKLDETHLYDSLTASIVIMAKEFSVEDGKNVVFEILSKIGFNDIKFVKKDVTSKYYAPQTEFEVYARHAKSNEYIEIGNCGFYSPVSLSNYDLPYPVWNFGLGIERALMALSGEEDIRRLVYPYFYKEVHFDDSEIAASISLVKQPESEEGKKLVETIVKTALEHANDSTPAKVKVFEGKFMDKKVEVKIVKNEAGKKLLGPAAFNPIVVKDGNIIGALPDKIPENAINTGLTYMHGIANLFAHELENAIKNKKQELVIEVKDVKGVSDVNISVDENIRNFIKSKNKRIQVVGPVFVWLTAKIS